MDDPLARYRPYLAMTVLFLVVLVGTVFMLRRPEPSALVVSTSTPRPTATLASIVVDVRGAVASPGVYTLPAGSRVQEALVLAGDVLSDAETRGINLARKLNDGEQIYVPTFAEATLTPALSLSRGSKTPAGKININTAPVEELDTLPGIGPALAQRIIDYRTQNGAFKRIEDLKNVRGIGDVLLGQIKDLIAVD